MATPTTPIRCAKCGAKDSRAYNPPGDDSGWTCARGEGCRRAELCRKPLIVNAWCEGEPGHEGKCHIAGAERDEGSENLLRALSGDQVLRERAECIEAVEAEAEPLGAMPDELWARIANDREAAGRALLAAVRLSKRNIAARIRARNTAQGGEGAQQPAATHHRAADRTCVKVEHRGTGHLHAADDDSPYDVDRVMYCGRCHHAIDANGNCSVMQLAATEVDDAEGSGR